MLSDLPAGSSPEPVAAAHFPSRLHAYVWRNWELVPAARLASVVGASERDVASLAASMGLPPQSGAEAERLRLGAVTVIRRNWHLLPYDQLLDLLGWSAERLAFTLREDDFLFNKLGLLKPRCPALAWEPPGDESTEAVARLAAAAQAWPSLHQDADPLFSFVARSTEVPDTPPRAAAPSPRFAPRYCYSYFGSYGDPLLASDAGPYPDGLLARLGDCGVDGVWLQGVLEKLAPFPWAPERSEGFDQRRARLAELVERAGRFGIGVYLYLNEPRALPLAFFDEHPDLFGVEELEHGTLCTSHPDVRRYLRDSVRSLFEAVPALAGVFTITASENLTSCWSHKLGDACTRCRHRAPAEVVAEVTSEIREGVRAAGSDAAVVAWDWAWPPELVPDIVERLPADVRVMSTSEWGTTLRRGGVEVGVIDYTISVTEPAPQACRVWSTAKARGMATLAKVQVGTTWELAAVPYLPAVDNVARHIDALRRAEVDGLMLSWTLGGYPSPAMEVVGLLSDDAALGPDEAIAQVARRRFGDEAAPTVIEAWRRFSEAIREFPFHVQTVYLAPLQMGPANPLWAEPTGYAATMTGIPYDDLESWRSVYPVEVYIDQLDRVAAGFEAGVRLLDAAPSAGAHAQALEEERRVAVACACHFRSAVNQARFVRARDALAHAAGVEASRLLDEVEALLADERAVAERLLGIQVRDSRIGFEATNHYFYVPSDLVEKMANCDDLLQRWLPGERSRRAAVA